MTPASTKSRRVSLPSPRKTGWIIGLALATAAPGFLMSQLIGERENRAASVRDDIVKAWGPEQRVAGPKLVLPVTGKTGKPQDLALAPRALEVKVILVPSLRRRGLFAVTVYEATIAMTGAFDLPEGFREGGPDAPTQGTGVIAVSLPGTQGIRDGDRAEVTGTKGSWQACLDADPNGGCSPDAIVAEADLTKVQGATVPFSLTLHLRGTNALRIATAAKHATIRIQGAWPTPSFTGTDLPVASAVTSDGFEAEWIQDRIGQPRYVKGATISGIDAQDSVVGVDLIEGVPVYRTITRGSKYGLLIVALAFAAYFLFEVATGVAVGLLQYGLLGASLSLFMLLLLSISEIAGFDLGYATSAFLVSAQASLYTVSITRRPGLAAVFAAMLAAVFGFFYILLGLESYALVIGAAGLFLVLSIIMGVTQAITPPGVTAERVQSE